MSLQLFGYKSSSVNTALLATSAQAQTIITDVAAVQTDVDAIQTDVNTIEAGVALPAADATTNTLIGEVIGNKTDAAQTVVAGTRSLMGYIKGLLGMVGTNSVQTGTITMTDPATSNTATVTAVNTGRYFLIMLGSTTNNTSQNGAIVNARITLTNATTITAARDTGTGNVTVGFLLVEMKA